MTMQKTGDMVGKDSPEEAMRRIQCPHGCKYEAVATLHDGEHSSRYVELTVTELPTHTLSPAGEASVIANAVKQAGPPEGPKWIPKLIHAGAWSVGYYEGDAWEEDGGPFTYAEAQKRAAWLNEQEPAGATAMLGQGIVWMLSACPICGQQIEHPTTYTPTTCGKPSCVHEAEKGD